MAKVLQRKQLHQPFSPRQLPAPKGKPVPSLSPSPRINKVSSCDVWGADAQTASVRNALISVEIEKRSRINELKQVNCPQTMSLSSASGSTEEGQQTDRQASYSGGADRPGKCVLFGI
ncbi:unnamed protein product [Pleuronectes platessa]|uniref:Uncharacterized protein n=1 Tax=Pleuronectes platessa TaxID=8262 RepID=A0A9N7TQ64_PLEPL|nr:unnamed protein product [Pleuronectes platessa]